MNAKDLADKKIIVARAYKLKFELYMLNDRVHSVWAQLAAAQTEDQLFKAELRWWALARRIEKLVQA